MRKGFKCTLTCLSTGEKITFKTGSEASLFLGRARSYVTNCVDKGCVITHAKTKEIYDAVLENYEPPAPPKRGVQLCCTCKNATGGCSWSRRFEPVKGWVAIPTKIQHGNIKGKLRMCNSYRILSCPEYERG